VHPPNHVELAFFGALGIQVRTVFSRRLGQTRQKSTLAESEFLYGLSKISASCGLNTISPVTEINLVQIEIKNLLVSLLIKIIKK
jgi:hypothetical protein